MTTYTHGIDVSKYQGNVDWAQVAASGQAFAFVRLGYINRDGTITGDPYWERNITGAIGVGLQVGAYLYSYLESEDAARLAANRAMELCEPYGLRMPIALDYEHAALYQSMTGETNAAICRAFLETVEAGGYIPVIYTYYSAAKNWLPLDKLSAPRWLANYTGTIGIDGVDIWQYSSSGSVPGIPGRVDVNKAYNDFWTRHANAPLTPVWQPLTDKVLEVFGTRKTECFASTDVDDIVCVLEKGKTYPVLGVLAGVIGGYSWATISVDGHEQYVALLDDRCRIVDAPAACGHEAELEQLRAEVSRLTAMLDAVRTALGG